MVNENNPDYQRTRRRFDVVLGKYRAVTERIEEDMKSKAEALEERERQAGEQAEAPSDSNGHGLARPATSSLRPHGRHAKPDEDDEEEEDFFNRSFIR